MGGRRCTAPMNRLDSKRRPEERAGQRWISTSAPDADGRSRQRDRSPSGANPRAPEKRSIHRPNRIGRMVRPIPSESRCRGANPKVHDTHDCHIVEGKHSRLGCKSADAPREGMPETSSSHGSSTKERMRRTTSGEPAASGSASLRQKPAPLTRKSVIWRTGLSARRRGSSPSNSSRRNIEFQRCTLHQELCGAHRCGADAGLPGLPPDPAVGEAARDRFHRNIEGVGRLARNQPDSIFIVTIGDIERTIPTIGMFVVDVVGYELVLDLETDALSALLPTATSVLRDRRRIRVWRRRHRPALRSNAARLHRRQRIEPGLCRRLTSSIYL